MTSEGTRRTAAPIEPVAITALGACTCLGGITTAAAAARAGLSRAADLVDWQYLDEETREWRAVVGAPIPGVTDGFEGVGRLIRMSALAAEDLLGSATWLEPRRTLCFVALPAATGPSGAASLAQQVAAPLAQGLGVRFDAVRCYTSGKEGTLNALRDAEEAIRKHRCDHAIVGGADSMLDPARRDELIGTGRVKTMNHPVGFIPGEAAAFLLLERLHATGARGRPPEAILMDICDDAEDSNFASDKPPTGRALTRALTAALARVGAPEGRGTVYLDLNGEPYRAADWGCAIARMGGTHNLHAWAQALPVSSFGDTGAASAPLAACLAARAFARRYADGEQALVVSSADGATRLVMALKDPYAAGVSMKG